MHRSAAGGPIHLIQWSQDRDGCWTHEIQRGRYLRFDPDAWVVEVDGIEQRLPRNTWSQYIPDRRTPARGSPTEHADRAGNGAGN